MLGPQFLLNNTFYASKGEKGSSSNKYKEVIMSKATLKIGCHLGIADGYLSAAKTAVSIGANTFQYFSRNPRGGSARAVDAGDIAAFLLYADEHDLLPVLAHAPYTLNAASGTEATRAFAESCMSGDLKTLRMLGGAANYTFHPGSHTGIGAGEGIGYIVELLNRILGTGKRVDSPFILLEAMSGKGSELGAEFSQLRRIIDGANQNEHLGVCVDTCHIFAAGYDIVNNLDGVLAQFDREVGLNRLRAIHLNDSMMPFGSKKDRHAKIGEGLIGADALVKLTNHKSLRHLPYYLETPNELEGYAAEIAFFRKNFSG